MEHCISDFKMERSTTILLSNNEISWLRVLQRALQHGFGSHSREDGKISFMRGAFSLFQRRDMIPLVGSFCFVNVALFFFWLVGLSLASRADCGYLLTALYGSRVITMRYRCLRVSSDGWASCSSLRISRLLVQAFALSGLHGSHCR